MKNKFNWFLLIVVLLFFESSKIVIPKEKLNNDNNKIHNIHFSGYFYKYIPYNVYFQHDDIKVTSNHTKIDSIKNGIRFNPKTRDYIRFIDKKTDKKILNIEVNVGEVPISVFFGGKDSGGEIYLNTFPKKIGAFVSNLGVSFSFRVESFDVIVYIKGVRYVLSSKSNDITEEQLKHIKQLGDGDAIIITNIMIKTPDEIYIAKDDGTFEVISETSLKKLPPCVYFIKKN